jgi:hypothetical protein
VSARLASWLAAWAGLVAAPMAWALHQQVLADVTSARCTASGASLTLLVGLAAGLVASIGGLVSLRAWRRGGGTAWGMHDEPRRFVAAMSAMAGALFLLVILLQTLAGLIVPECAR